MFLSIILIFLHVQVAFWQLLINEHNDDDDDDILLWHDIARLCWKCH